MGGDTKRLGGERTDTLPDKKVDKPTLAAGLTRPAGCGRRKPKKTFSFAGKKGGEYFPIRRKIRRRPILLPGRVGNPVPEIATDISSRRLKGE